MAHPNARLKGPKFESDLVKWFRARGYDAERLRMAGKDDQGDVRVLDDGDHVVIEAKAAVRFNLAAWIVEATVERANYAKARGLPDDRVEGILVVKAPGRPIGDAYVIQRLSDYFGESR